MNLREGGLGGWAKELAAKGGQANALKEKNDPEAKRLRFEKVKANRKPFNLSAEAKQKISLSKIGKPRSEETKRKMSETRTGKTYGPMTVEAKANISIALKGKSKTSEHKAALSISATGRIHTAEHKLKNSLSRIGNKWWNNGIVSVISKNKPAGSWEAGRIKLGSYKVRPKKPLQVVAL
jgi:hypothetical protein